MKVRLEYKLKYWVSKDAVYEQFLQWCFLRNMDREMTTLFAEFADETFGAVTFFPTIETLDRALLFKEFDQEDEALLFMLSHEGWERVKE